MNILLLEDDKQLNRAISAFLNIKGYHVTSFYNGNDVLAQMYGYDIYILDINTPNINGIDILKYINDIVKNVKVIMISANIDINTIKSAYESGCYDYLKKPFQIEELYLKIKNIQKEIDQNISLGNGLVFNINEKQLYKNSVQIDLTKKEAQLLSLLVKNNKNTLTYEQIEFELYNNDSVAHTTIRTLIKRLREKVGKEIIKTVVNIGYKL